MAGRITTSRQRTAPHRTAPHRTGTTLRPAQRPRAESTKAAETRLIPHKTLRCTAHHEQQQPPARSRVADTGALTRSVATLREVND
jgi:hypothetical protein